MATTTTKDEEATALSGTPVDETAVTSQPDGPAAPAMADVRSVRKILSVSMSLRSAIIGALVAVLTVAVVIVGWSYLDVRSQLQARDAQSANDSRAEKMALDYAVNAATMDYKDLQAWKVKLVQGTSPELNKKLSDAGTSMEQVLVPLQWSSSAKPLVAKVRSDAGGIYVVDSFVSVNTKTIQSPEPLQSTATYSLTLDSNSNWQITDVGGIGSALESK